MEIEPGREFERFIKVGTSSSLWKRANLDEDT